MINEIQSVQPKLMNILSYQIIPHSKKEFKLIKNERDI